MFIGVSSLTLDEIRSDIRSILASKTQDNNHINNDNYLNHDAETDSDSSIKSDEISDSEYPVQPRNISKSDRVDTNDFRYNENNNIYSTATNIDGSLFYLDDIRRHRADLFEGERLREELEQCSLVKLISHAQMLMMMMIIMMMMMMMMMYIC
jgi:hypothetical protein